MAINGVEQYADKTTISVGKKQFKINSDIKIFINGKSVKPNNVQNELKTLSPNDIALLEKQLDAIQKYNGVYAGRHDEIERGDFEHCSDEQCKKTGVKYTPFCGEDGDQTKLGCANGKFELLW